MEKEYTRKDYRNAIEAIKCGYLDLSDIKPYVDIILYALYYVLDSYRDN